MAGFGAGNFGIGTFGNGGWIATADPDSVTCGDSGNSLNSTFVGNAVQVQPVIDIANATYKGFLLCTSIDSAKTYDKSASIGGWSVIPG